MRGDPLAPEGGSPAEELGAALALVATGADAFGALTADGGADAPEGGAAAAGEPLHAALVRFPALLQS